MTSPGPMAITAITSTPVQMIPAVFDVLLQAAPGVDAMTFWAILTALGGTVVTLATFAWREREKRAVAERALATVQTELAVATTKLLAYGKSAPELADEVRRLGELFAQLIEEDGQDRDRDEPPHREHDRLPWPYERPRPVAPRRRQR